MDRINSKLFIISFLKKISISYLKKRLLTVIKYIIKLIKDHVYGIKCICSNSSFLILSSVLISQTISFLKKMII